MARPSGRRETARAILGAALPPLLVFLVQRAIWPLIVPYAWFMFVPALFVSAWIGGLRIGVATSAIVSVVVWWSFVPPEGALDKAPRHLLATVVFFGTGVLFSVFHERLRRATRRSHETFAELRAANEEVSRLYAKAQEIDALKTRFFASVSHELRTPLTLVIGPTERLASAADLDEETRDELEGIAHNARIVARHVDDLLDAAKIEAGRMKPEHADVDVALLTRLVVEPFATVAREKGVTLDVEAPGTLRAELDPAQARAIVTNLVSNALKFTPPAGHIRVSLRETPDGERVALEVADSGPGIPLEEREAVFERFHQVEGADRARGGTGLGLAIARDFVSLHGGTIAMLDAPEGGTLARVELPRRAPPGTTVRGAIALTAADAEAARQRADELRERETAAPPSVEDGEGGPLVLVVEDNRAMNRFIRESIPPGYRVAAAFDGREGLAKAKALVPDLILVDLMMPEMSGEELVHALRGVTALASTPILVLTAKADEEVRIRLLREGAQDYLVKPFVVDELRARIDNLLAAKRAFEAQTRLASLVEQAPDGIFVADLDGRYVEVNAAGCRLLGLARGEILGKTILDLIPPEDAERLSRSREGMLAGGHDVSEWTLRRKDGTYVPVEVSAQILSDGRWQGLVRDISERRRVEEELRRSETDLNRAQGVARIGSWRLDVGRDELAWSAESHHIFGVPEGTPMTYEAFLAIVHPDDRALVDEKWRAALAGAPYDLEHRVLVAGQVKWVRERAELVFDEEGRVLGGIGTTQDITDQKRIEQALQTAERRAVEASARVRALSDAGLALAEAVAGLPDESVATVMGAIAVQAQTLVSAEYVAIGIGTDPDVPFDPWIQVGMPAPLSARLGRAPRPVGALGLVARHNRAVRVPDLRELAEFRGFPPGHPVMTSFLGVPILFKGASIGNLYLANKRGAAEFTAEDQQLVELLAARAGAALETARLYESEALGRTWIQTVVDQMPEGVLLLDADGHITTQNRTLRALSRSGGAANGERDPFGNRVLIDLRLPSGARVPAAELPYVHALARGDAFSGREYQVQRSDGSAVAVLVGAAPVLAASGARTGAVMVVQDVTAMKELERLREEWTSVIAHELRQPVNVISLSAAMLDETGSAPTSEQERTRVIATIHRAAKSLDRMIGDLLDASRIEARRMAVSRHATSLPRLVREVVERIPEVAGRGEVSVTPGAEREVLADPERIEQVLTNLLTNAAKYGERETRIRVDVIARDREIEVVVTNRGAGIAPEEMPRLFRRFERAHEARAGRVPGIGLGLYLCKGLIEAHEGRIWVESTPGASTRFHFTLPYAPGREAAVARA